MISIIGSGGHAKVIIDALEKNQLTDIRLYDDNEKRHGTYLFDYPIKGNIADLLNYTAHMQFIIAIGDNQIRKEQFNFLIKKCDALIIKHPSVQIGRSVSIATGTVILANVIINPAAYIGKNVIINTASVIEHDCHIDDHAHIAPRVTLCGGVRVGEETLIGAGATVIPNIKIGRQCIIGAGAVVIKDVPDNTTVTGCPAKAIVKT